MRTHFAFIAFIFLLCACGNDESARDTDVVVKVKDESLSRATINGQMPKGLSTSDSLLYAENIQKKWVKDKLVYDVAMRNLESDEKANIDQLVDEYKRSLIRNRYEEKLVREKLEIEISEQEKQKYYEDNKERFVLDNAILKGVFLKIPSDAPGLSDVKNWYKKIDEASIEKIEKYSVQNAMIYEYFLDKWVDFNDVFDNMPLHISDSNEFLRANRLIEYSDSSFCYLLNVSEFIPSGNVAPYECAEPRIKELIINLKKVDFLNKFENDLYNEAVKNGNVKLKTEP